MVHRIFTICETDTSITHITFVSSLYKYLLSLVVGKEHRCVLRLSVVLTIESLCCQLIDAIGDTDEFLTDSEFRVVRFGTAVTIATTTAKILVGAV